MTETFGEITYWHMAWDAQAHIHGEDRTATLSLDLPHEILFRLLVTPRSHLPIQKGAASYFVELATTRFDDVLQYLRAFFLRIVETCDLSSPELATVAQGRGSEFDFPRPSPSWMMLEEFCKGLRHHAELCRQLRDIPVRWL
jgi:hypothetical protein